MLVISILFLISISFSWVIVDVKLSTKNPDLNLFNPEESATNKFAVFVSNKDNEV